MLSRYVRTSQWFWMFLRLKQQVLNESALMELTFLWARTREGHVPHVQQENWAHAS